MTPLIADAPWLRTADGLILFLGAVSKDQGATVLGHRQAHAASRRYRRYAVRPMLPLAPTQGVRHHGYPDDAQQTSCRHACSTSQRPLALPHSRFRLAGGIEPRSNPERYVLRDYVCVTHDSTEKFECSPWLVAETRTCCIASYTHVHKTRRPWSVPTTDTVYRITRGSGTREYYKRYNTQQL